MIIPQDAATKYITKADLHAPIAATVASVQLQDMASRRGNDQRHVLTFTDERIKPLVLRPVNLASMIGLYGRNTDEWIGKPLEIFINPAVEMGGEVVGGIRIRKPKV